MKSHAAAGIIFTRSKREMQRKRAAIAKWSEKIKKKTRRRRRRRRSSLLVLLLVVVVDEIVDEN